MGEHPFPDMTADMILRQTGRQTGGRIIKSVIGIILVIFALMGILSPLTESFSWANLLVGIFLLPAVGLAIYGLLHKIGIQFSFGQSLPDHQLVSPYATAKQIAAAVTDPANVQLIDSKKCIFTRGYLMMRNDFQTYLPLNQIRQIEVKIGYDDIPAVYMAVTDKTGRKCSYVLENQALPNMLKKQKQQVESAPQAQLALSARDVRLICDREPVALEHHERNLIP